MKYLMTAVVAFSATISVANAASVAVNANPAAVVSAAGNTDFNSAITASIGAIGETIRFTYTDEGFPGVIGNGTAEVNVGVDLDANADPASLVPDINELVTFTNAIGGAGDVTVYRIDFGIDSAPGSSNSNPFGSLTINSYTVPGGVNTSTTGLISEAFTLWLPLVGGAVFDIEATGLVADGNNFSVTVSAVPVPAAGVLFGSALLGAAALRRRKLQQKLGLPQ